MDPKDPDEAARPEFEGIRLCVGWKIVNETVVEEEIPGQKRTRREVLIDWDERTVEDSFVDVRTFATNLAQRLEDRLEASTDPVSSSFFDISEIFKLLCGKRLPDGRVRLQEGNLEQYGLEEFRHFFREVCDLEHIKNLDNELFDERLYAKVLGSFKHALRMLAWDVELKDTLISCFKIFEDDDKVAVSLLGSGPLLQMEYVPPLEHLFLTHCEFLVKFSGKESMKVQLLEEEVIKALYCNEVLHSDDPLTGRVAMTSFDIALAMGGPEAIAESFYSVMDTQRQYGGQSHASLEDRTLLDWATSNVLKSEEMIRRAAKLYVDGKKEERLSRHRVGQLRKTCNSSYKASKVLTRFAEEQGRYSFL